MLLRALFLLAFMLGSHAGLAAEAATDAEAAATGSDAATAGTAASTGQDEAAAGAGEAANDDASAEEGSGRSLDGEGFVPSVQISEDLSVSFPTDI